MKPNIALSLSYEGITVFARQADDRWMPLGSMAPQSGDPDASEMRRQLANLRQAAVGAAGAQFTTLLILPPEHVLFTETDVEGDETAPQEIMAFLDGRTPYALDELVFDWSGSGGQRRYVAAAALETLAEMEAFGVEHGFNPVSFTVAVPEERFIGQPFFGECAGARALTGGAVVEPENGPFRVAPPTDTPQAETTASETQPGNAPDESPPMLRFRRASGAVVSDPETAVLRLRSITPRIDRSTRIAPDSDDPPAPAPRQPTPRKAGMGLGLVTAAVFGLLAIGIGVALMSPDRAPPTAPETDIARQEVPERVPSTAELLPAPGSLSVPEDGSFSAVALAPLPNELAPEPEPGATAPLPEGITEETAQSGADLPPEAETTVAERPEDQLETAPEVFAAPPALPSAREVVETYAATGIWTGTPEAPEPSSEDMLADLYQTTLDAPIDHADAVALPDTEGQLDTGPSLSVLPPAQPGTLLALADSRLTSPAAEDLAAPEDLPSIGSQPDPETLPGALPESPEVAVSPDDADTPSTPTEQTLERARLALLPPTPRPDDFAEAVERVLFDGLTLAELRQPSPTPRPASLQDQAEEEARIAASVAAAAAQAAQQASLGTPGSTSGGSGGRNPGGIALQGRTAEPPVRVTVQSDSALAIARSAVPRARPDDFSRTVARAQQVRQPRATAAASTAAVSRPARTLPTGGSVARAATQSNALPLRQVNLIGVFGKPSAPKALVRLSNGRILRVGVGDRVDNGRVTSIGPGRLTYRKGNRDLVLEMPRI